MKKTTLLLTLLLSGCGASGVVKDANSDIYTISASQSWATGGWNLASTQATTKAQEFCKSAGKAFFLNNEKRDGVPGWTLLTTTIKFSCGQDIAGLHKVALSDCSNDMKSEQLDPIREKVELMRMSNDDSPPFGIATNNSFPTEKERDAIAKWAKIREGCVKRDNDIILSAPKPSNPLQAAFYEQILAFRKQVTSRVGELIVALYQSKLTYGEFAQKRYEMVSNIQASERDYRSSVLLSDRDAQFKAQQLAQQQQSNNLAAWSTYMQSVNSRQPQTVHLQTNCTTSKVGNNSTTNCF